MKNLIHDVGYQDNLDLLRDEAEKLKKQYGYNPDRDWWLRQVVDREENPD